MKASLVDAAAREVLAARGLGDAFVHGNGHGLGLEVHEEPRVTRPGSPALDEVLRPGMVFTVEPGAHLPGAHGVRIEDDVVVTAGLRGADQRADRPDQDPGVREPGRRRRPAWPGWR